MCAYLSKAFDLQVPTKVGVPCVHMLQKKEIQPCYKEEPAGHKLQVQESSSQWHL